VRLTERPQSEGTDEDGAEADGADMKLRRRFEMAADDLGPLCSEEVRGSEVFWTFELPETCHSFAISPGRSKPSLPRAETDGFAISVILASVKFVSCNCKTVDIFLFNFERRLQKKSLKIVRCRYHFLSIKTLKYLVAQNYSLPHLLSISQKSSEADFHLFLEPKLSNLIQ
jgi:hypothetical protein